MSKVAEQEIVALNHAMLNLLASMGLALQVVPMEVDGQVRYNTSMKVVDELDRKLFEDAVIVMQCRLQELKTAVRGLDKEHLRTSDKKAGEDEVG